MFGAVFLGGCASVPRLSDEYAVSVADVIANVLNTLGIIGAVQDR